MKTDQDSETQQRLLEVLSTWPVDRTQGISHLFSDQARWAAGRQLPSQKAINRRKALATPGQYPAPKPTDPKIPVMLLSSNPRVGGVGNWTLLLPWKCVLPVWYGLMYYPLSVGGTLRFGGLDQLRQVHFESGIPWFPGDFAGTKAGMTWEEQERQKRKAQWERRPKGKRVEYESVKLGQKTKGEQGLGWACDWERLVNGSEGVEAGLVLLDHVPASEARKALSQEVGSSKADITKDEFRNKLATVKITALQKGVSNACARIYRLPTADAELRRKWVDLAASRGRRPAQKKKPMAGKIPVDAPAHARRQQLAARLLEPEQGSEAEHIEVPGEEDIIGFVTTGNYNLAEGKGTSIGGILLSRVAAAAVRPEAHDQHKHVCIVRESGHALGRLGRWEFV